MSITTYEPVIPEPEKPDGCMKAVIIVIAAIFIIGAITGIKSLLHPGESFTVTGQELHSDIRTSLTTFSLLNKDNFDYTGEITITINGEYELTMSNPIGHGQLFEVGLMQFAKSDGTRFNPVQQKILNIDISCHEGFSHYQLN